MAENEQAKTRLILLYIMDLAPNLRYSSLLQLALDSLQTDFFSFQSALSALLEDGLVIEISEYTEGTDVLGNPYTRYSLSPKGTDVLDVLSPQLPPTIRRWLDVNVEPTVLKTAEDEDLIIRWMRSEKDNGYFVNVHQLERLSPRLLLTFGVPNEAMAKKAADTLKRRVGDLYKTVINLALSDEDGAEN
jgi:hypothetical protein